MLRSIIVSVLLVAGAVAIFHYLQPLTALLALGGAAVVLLLLAALTSAFHRPAEAQDRLLRA